MNKDQKLLAEAYSKMLLKEDEQEQLLSPEDFMKRVFRDNDSSYRNYYSIYFGKVTEGERAGQMYALVYNSEDYDDGDRWFTEESQRLYFNKIDTVKYPGRNYLESSEWLSEEEAEPWKVKAMKEFPELNKHQRDS